MHKRKIILSIVLILAITFIAFFPSLHNGFTNWDDDAMLTKNPKIMGMSWDNLKSMWTQEHKGLYHPLVLMSYAIEYRFFKFNPFVYHLDNLILHILNCILVFWLFLLLSKSITVALLVSLLFGIHPLHVESVAWITERKDVLYALFFLGSYIAYLYYYNKRSLKFYILSLSLFVLSLLSKPMAVTLPIVLIITDYFLSGKIKIRTTKDKIPYFVLCGVFAVIAIFARKPPETAVIPYTIFDNLLIASYGLLFYPIKMLVPYNLACFYPDPAKTGGFLHIIYWIAPAGTAIIAVIIFATRKFTGKIIFGTLFYLITVLPVLHFIPGGPTAANHYTYIPLIGLFYILAEGFLWIYKKAEENNQLLRQLLVVLILIIIIGLSAITWQRCTVWKDSISLWNDFIDKFGNRPNISNAYNNRGNAYRDIGKYDKALADYNEALSLNPDYSGSYNNRGNIYGTRGEHKKAIAEYNRAIDLDPDFAAAYFNRGAALLNTGEFDKAIEDFTQVIGFSPGYTNAYISRGNAYFSIKDYENALKDYSSALELEPYNTNLLCQRGIALIRLGKIRSAFMDFGLALKINPRCAAAYNGSALAFFVLKDYEKAMESVKIASQLGYKINPVFIKLLEEKSKNEP